MNKLFVPFLPPWVETGLQPAFYDKESGTVLQQTARMYDKVNQLIRNFNDLSKETKETVEEYILQFTELKDFVDDYFENLDVQEEINNKLDDMAEDGTLETILNNTLFSDIEESKDNYALLAFFDTSDSNKINFFTSKDMIHLTKLGVSTNITGRDPSLYYKDGKFYIAVTNYTSTYDFVIYVSEDLETWTQHNINLGLYNATYPKIWCPEWFEDGSKLYIILSKQYANTEGSGDFKPYIVECTDLENLTFGTPSEITLSGNTYDNYIDGVIFKKSGVYNLILKNEHQGIMRLEKFTSSSIDGTFVLADDNYGQLGQYYEGQFVVVLNGKYYLGAERYTNTIAEKSTYTIKESDDGASYGNGRMMEYQGIDLSHGSAIAIDEKELKTKLKASFNFNSKYTSCFTQANNTHLHAFNTYVSGSPVDNYLKLFTIVPKKANRSCNIIFNITDAMSNTNTIDSTIYIRLKNAGLNDPTNYTVAIKETANNNSVASNYKRGSLFSKIVAYYDSTEGGYTVAYDISSNDADKAVISELVSMTNGGDFRLKYHTDNFTSSIGTEVTANANDAHKSKADNTFAQNIYIDNQANTSLTLEICCSNGVATLIGEENGKNSANIVDGYLTFYNGDVTFTNRNTSSTSNIAVTVNSYSNRWYNITLSGMHAYSGMMLSLPPYYGNAIISATYSS